jgi:homoserine O-acetyltransferase
MDPETGEPYGSSFPPVTVGDWTRAQARLLDSLEIDRLRAVVGGSVGGTNVLEWARRYPDRIDRIVPIATGPRLGPQLLALHATARRAIVGDPNWQGGDYYGEGPDPDHGLAQARRIGHVTYLSATSMDRRFGRRAVGGDASTGEGKPDEEVRRENPAWAPDPGDDRTHEAFPYREVA